ncbi:putative alkaline shock family protein YloU [Actinopolyspora lacussalsi]|nr:putative alkaline shock family protein YloU [Actinopolyspora lacussalsi]
MTGTVGTAESAATTRSEHGGITEPSERGGLRIDRGVLRRIAEHAADSVSNCVRTRRRVAGLGTGEHGATARLAGPERQLRIRLDLALRYPAPIAETVSAVRERVRTELERMADCRVATVDVTVTALVPHPTAPRVE